MATPVLTIVILSTLAAGTVAGAVVLNGVTLDFNLNALDANDENAAFVYGEWCRDGGGTIMTYRLTEEGAVRRIVIGDAAPRRLLPNHGDFQPVSMVFQDDVLVVHAEGMPGHAIEDNTDDSITIHIPGEDPQRYVDCESLR